jgi:hypothetical protein
MHPPTAGDVGWRTLRALRANHFFGTDEKRIRTENAVMDKSKSESGLWLSKIAECVRTAFCPCAIGDPRGRAAVRASSSATVRSILRRLPISVGGHCALRAPTTFSVRIKSASEQKTRLLVKTKRFRFVLIQQRNTATPEGAIQITTYNARDFVHFAGRPRDSNNANVVGGSLGKR